MKPKYIVPKAKPNYLKAFKNTPLPFKIILCVLAASPMMLSFAFLNKKTVEPTAVVSIPPFPYQTLTIVSTPSPTTVFEQDGFKHGFGYDLARSYADSMNLKLNFVTVDSNKTALDWLHSGRAQMALTTDQQHQQYNSMDRIVDQCDAQSSLNDYGLHQNFTWVVSKKYEILSNTAHDYLCQSKASGQLQKLASFYATNYLPAHDIATFTKDLEERLPSYKQSFKRSAKQNNLDWQFLTAIAYQESYLKSDSVSPTGVKGVMMLTEGTAKDMGVEDRTDPNQSIQGGAKYFTLMLDQYKDVPYPDRNWFALVAYNMGPSAVNQIRKELKESGKNSNDWISFYQYLEENKKDNGRYQQALQYVKRIRVYLEHIKTSEQIAKI